MENMTVSSEKVDAKTQFDDEEIDTTQSYRGKMNNSKQSNPSKELSDEALEQRKHNDIEANTGTARYSPMNNESSLIKNNISSPTKNESLPTKKESTPTNIESSPTKNESPPTKDESSPTKNESSPTKNESAPTKKPLQDAESLETNGTLDAPSNDLLIHEQDEDNHRPNIEEDASQTVANPNVILATIDIAKADFEVDATDNKAAIQEQVASIENSMNRLVGSRPSSSSAAGSGLSAVRSTKTSDERS